MRSKYSTLFLVMLMCLTGCSANSGSFVNESTPENEASHDAFSSAETESEPDTTATSSGDVPSTPEETTAPLQTDDSGMISAADEYMFPADYFVLRDWTMDGAVNKGDIWYKDRSAPMLFRSDVTLYKEPDSASEKLTFCGPSFWMLKGTDREQWILLSKYPTGEEAWLLCDVQENGIVNGLGFTAGAHDAGNNSFIMAQKHAFLKETYSGELPADDECILYRISTKEELDALISQNPQNLMDDQSLREQLLSYTPDSFDQNQLLIMLYWSHFSESYSFDPDTAEQGWGGTSEIFRQNGEGCAALLQYHRTGWSAEKALVCSIIETDKQFELNWTLKQILLAEYSDDYVDCNILLPRWQAPL